MDSTTHTTQTIEFVNWREKAQAKLEREDKDFKGNNRASVVRKEVFKTLLAFCNEDARFAETVCKTKRTLSECCAQIVDGVTDAISDAEAYRRAAQFYFPNAEIQFQMIIRTGEMPTQEQLEAPAKIKPAEQKPAARAKPKKEPKKPKAPEKTQKPAEQEKPKAPKKAPKVDPNCIQLSLWED